MMMGGNNNHIRDSQMKFQHVKLIFGESGPAFSKIIRQFICIPKAGWFFSIPPKKSSKCLGIRKFLTSPHHCTADEHKEL
jgi:hypothetical protein